MSKCIIRKRNFPKPELTYLDIFTTEETGTSFQFMRVGNTKDCILKVKINDEYRINQERTAGAELAFSVGFELGANNMTINVSRGNYILPSNFFTTTTTNKEMVKGVILGNGYFGNTIINSQFSNFRKLESIELPKKIKKIGNMSFMNCHLLPEIDLSNIIEIGENSFNFCLVLDNVILGASVNSIGWRAFRNCSNLKSFTINTITPPSLGAEVFDNTHSSLTIYVPAESVDAYKAAPNWSTYAARIEAIA